MLLKLILHILQGEPFGTAVTQSMQIFDNIYHTKIQKNYYIKVPQKLLHNNKKNQFKCSRF